jgi:ubiquinone/menaquinone biosynthesis C-methylase UbiE
LSCYTRSDFCADEAMMLKPTYDAAAASFDRLRALPDGVAPAVRAAVLHAAGEISQPRLLDLGAGTGRLGWPYVAADDDYYAVDLSLGMLRAFKRRVGDGNGHVPRLAQAEGQRLPFRDTAFDAVLLTHVLSSANDWRRLVAEAERVLNPSGVLIIGRTVGPEDGIDAQMKRRLGKFIEAMGVELRRSDSADAVALWLDRERCEVRIVTAASWTAERTPHAFLERHATGARFSILPQPVKDAALSCLRQWAAATFGSLDAAFVEHFRFELMICRFRRGMSH